MTAPSIRVLVADDHSLIRQGVIRASVRKGGFQVVGEAEDGRAAVEQARRLEPDIVLMDIRMPHVDGIGATMKIMAERPATKVIILTVHDDERSVLRAIEAGASGYLLKTTGADDLAEAVRRVHAGEVLIDAGMVSHVVDAFRRLSEHAREPAAPTAAELEDLTEGEMDVLKRVALGEDNAEIAKCLSLATTTVRNRLCEVYRKLQVNNRTRAALEALRRGWVSLDDMDPGGAAG
ncbi:MAG: response regulator transcription factor [Anaerolineae bacterium]